MSDDDTRAVPKIGHGRFRNKASSGATVVHDDDDHIMRVAKVESLYAVMQLHHGVCSHANTHTSADASRAKLFSRMSILRTNRYRICGNADATRRSFSKAG